MSNFENNAAVGSWYASGGALYADRGTCIISSCNFKLNKAQHFGGAILLTNKISVVIRNAVFHNNSIIVLKHSFGGTLKPSNHLSEEEKLQNSGGALYTDRQANVNLSSYYFKGNVATYDGGAIGHKGDKLFVRNTTFASNAVIDSDNGTGGAIFIGKLSSMFISWSCFERNRATKAGGAINHLGTQLDVVHTIFEDNTVGPKDAFGGALYTRNQSIVELSWRHFKRNIATFGGGAISHFGRKLVIISTTFEYNFATGSNYS